MTAKRQAHAPVFAALGDETRLALVAKLCRGQPRSISQLTDDSRLTRQAITKHLRVLSMQESCTASVRVARTYLHSIRNQFKKSRNTSMPSPSSDQALSRLKSLVEGRVPGTDRGQRLRHHWL
jgi:DNA-binding transcriptional ArsR family regulator